MTLASEDTDDHDGPWWQSKSEKSESNISERKIEKWRTNWIKWKLKHGKWKLRSERKTLTVKAYTKKMKVKAKKKK